MQRVWVVLLLALFVLSAHFQRLPHAWQTLSAPPAWDALVMEPPEAEAPLVVRGLPPVVRAPPPVMRTPPPVTSAPPPECRLFSGVRSNGSSHAWGEQSADGLQVEIMGSLGPACTQLESYGSGDGEKRACGLKILTQNQKCTLVSIGSNNEWDFEEAAFDRLNCTMETLDCTVPQTTRPPERIASRTRFHHACIGPHDEMRGDRRYISWATLVKTIGGVPVYLKMDVEGAEFAVLDHLAPHWPMQIAFEIHTWGKSARQVSEFARGLHTAGFYFIDHRPNPGCYSCTEVLLSRMPCE
jgi:hypothetical protein